MIQEWQPIVLFGTALSFILTGLLNLVTYFLKKKDKSSDEDHEKISNINNSIVELRNTQLSQGGLAISLKQKLAYQDRVLDEHAKQIRDIEEAIRIIELFHNKNHQEFMNLSKKNP